MADYEVPAEDRKLLALLWPHVREMGHAKDDRTVCVGYFAANVVLGLVSRLSGFEKAMLPWTLHGQDQKRAVTQCKAHLKSLNLPSDTEVSKRLQIILDRIGPTFHTIIEMEDRKNKIAQTPGKGKGRVGLPLGVKRTPSKTPLKTTRSQGLVKELPLKRPREGASDDNEIGDSVLPMPKRVRVDSSTRSELSVIEESDIAEAPPSSKAEVESIVQFPLFGIGRGNSSAPSDLSDEGAEEGGGMDGMEVDEPIIRVKRMALGRLRQEVEVLEEEEVEEMGWPVLAAYRRRLTEASSKDRDMTEHSRARWRPVFADRTFWEVAV